MSLSEAFFDLREHFTSERLGALATMVENNDPLLIQGAYNRWMDEQECYGNCPIAEMLGNRHFQGMKLLPPLDGIRWNSFVRLWDCTPRAEAFHSLYQAIKRIFEERGERRGWRVVNWWDV